MDRAQEVGVRLLLEVQGKRRKLVRLVTREKDGSLYIIPFSITGMYYGKVANLGNIKNGFETQVAYRDTEPSIDKGAPHLSIHQSGLVRAYVTKGAFLAKSKHHR